jgi:superfamily II DNA or RNA helicase|tara:strand:+ start:671 stop:2188 length:1518 start_codon:yes stop_codon:yes gene_type:complete
MIQLREYQELAIEAVRHEFMRGKKKVLLVAPTGAGKTVIASAMIKASADKSNPSLFVAHRRELVKQCSSKLSDFGINHGVVMADFTPNNLASVQVASVQSYHARKDNEHFWKPKAKVIFLDEAHRSASKTFQDLIAEYPDAYVIGLTATPCRADGKGLGNYYDSLVNCGSISELTEKGFLTPARIIAPSMPDLKGLKMQAGDYEKRGLNTRMNQPKLVGDLVTHWVEHGENRPTVVFATSIAHSKFIAGIFNDNGIAAGHIDGEMDEVSRVEVLRKLHEGEIKVLSNCMVLTEGWDEPKVSCVVIARPTKSYGMYLQMVGRALRPFTGKVDTLIIDHSGCVYEHGFPDEAPEWELTSSEELAVPKKEPEPIEKQPCTCCNCQTVYKPMRGFPECPNCGNIPTKGEEALNIKQGRLVEVKRKDREPPSQDKANFYAQLLSYAISKKFAKGWADHTYKAKFGHFPHNKQVYPMPVGVEVTNFIKHLAIKKAKGNKFNKGKQGGRMND